MLNIVQIGFKFIINVASTIESHYNPNKISEYFVQLIS